MDTVMMYHMEAVDEMSRERLIEVVKELAEALEEERKRAQEAQDEWLKGLRR